MSANNEARSRIIMMLNTCIKLGYSGVTSTEYDALRVVKNYIKMFYEQDRKSSGSEDK